MIFPCFYRTLQIPTTFICKMNSLSSHLTTLPLHCGPSPYSSNYSASSLCPQPREPLETLAVTPTVALRPSLKSRSRMWLTSSARTSPSSRLTSPFTPTPSCSSSPTLTPTSWLQITLSWYNNYTIL